MFWRFGKPGGFVWGGAGVLLGLVLGGLWPNTPLHAVATDRYEKFGIATGYCDDAIEAVWFLDFVTGDLRAVALSKQSGTFNVFFARNILADLGVDPTKNPRFLMATGTADLRRSGGARLSPSRSILYVAEVTTGVLGAYSIPWSSTGWVSGQRLGGDIVLLDKTPLRGTAPVVVGRGKE
jgi:hypothetical protein